MEITKKLGSGTQYEQAKSTRSPETRSRRRLKKGYVDYKGNDVKFTKSELKKVVDLSDLKSKFREHSTERLIVREVGYYYSKQMHGTNVRGINKARKMEWVERAKLHAEIEVMPLNYKYGYKSKSKKRKIKAAN